MVSLDAHFGTFCFPSFMNIWNWLLEHMECSHNKCLTSFSANFIICVSFGLVLIDDSRILGCILLLLGTPGNFWWMPNIGNLTWFDAGEFVSLEVFLPVFCFRFFLGCS